MGTGNGNIIILMLGSKTVRAPKIPLTAPDAPKAGMYRLVKSEYRRYAMFPTIPDMKNIFIKFYLEKQINLNLQQV